MVERAMINFCKANASDFKLWNEFIIKSPNGNLRQTTFWGEIKELTGWIPHYYFVERDGEICALALVQERRIPLSPKALLYCCRGPVVDWYDKEACEKLFAGLKEVIKQKNSLLLRVDPEPVAAVQEQERTLLGMGLQKIPDRFSQWNRTLYTTRVMLDLDEEKLFIRMRRTHRQNINKAIKEGITTSYETEPDDSEQFATLMQGLELRKNSILHTKSYYTKTIQNLVESGIGYFLKAKLDGKIISGLIVTVLGDKAWAVFVANDYAYRRLMPNKLLLWEAVRLAKSLKCRFLDLGASQGSGDFDPQNDSLDNLKNAYGPEIIYYPGYFDLPNSFYALFRTAESKIIPLLLKYYVKVQRMTKQSEGSR
jgi:peptidoglycan pentaglycine glycine transferase (the first glycine)